MIALLLDKSYEILNQLRLSHGLYVASPSTYYSYVWIRDSVYMSLPFLDRDDGYYEKTFHRLFDLFLEYEWKIDLAIENKPTEVWQYIHARYSADTVEEITNQPWGHAQNDAIGLFLYGVAQGINYGRKIFRDENDERIVQKLVYYLSSVEFWHDEDNGMWEESRALHASSIGACVAGLRAVKSLVTVDEELIEKGLESIFHLFPHESPDKNCDLAQLSLIYPYRIFTGAAAEEQLEFIMKRLARTNGVIRYEGDSYYSTLEKEHGRNQDRSFYHGTEGEWVFGFPWISLCYRVLGQHDKADEYLHRTERLSTHDGNLPELYYAKSIKPNPNTPLGWSHAMYILAKKQLLI